MANLLLLFYIVLLIATVAAGVWALLLLIKKDEIPIDYTIVYSLLGAYTGYWETMELKVIPGKLRDASIGIPRDINYVEYFKDKIKLDTVKVKTWYEKNKRLDFPRGTLSPHRNVAFLLPKNPEDLPNNLKLHPLGKFLIESTAKANTEKTIVDVMRVESDRTAEIARQLGGREPLGEDFFALLTGKQKDALDASTRDKDKSSTSGGYGIPQKPS